MTWQDAYVRTACLQGLGITLLSYWDVRTQLAEGLLEAIKLKDAKPKVSSVWALTPTRQYVPSRVDVFLNALRSAVDVTDIREFL